MSIESISRQNPAYQKVVAKTFPSLNNINKTIWPYVKQSDGEPSLKISKDGQLMCSAQFASYDEDIKQHLSLAKEEPFVCFLGLTGKVQEGDEPLFKKPIFQKVQKFLYDYSMLFKASSEANDPKSLLRLFEDFSNVRENETIQNYAKSSYSGFPQLAKFALLDIVQGRWLKDLECLVAVAMPDKLMIESTKVKEPSNLTEELKNYLLEVNKKILKSNLELKIEESTVEELQNYLAAFEEWVQRSFETIGLKSAELYDKLATEPEVVSRINLIQRRKNDNNDFSPLEFYTHSLEKPSGQSVAEWSHSQILHSFSSQINNNYKNSFPLIPSLSLTQANNFNFDEAISTVNESLAAQNKIAKNILGQTEAD